jgi:hopanoid biosynthesis associated RND transporter like protein HpnN
VSVSTAADRTGRIGLILEHWVGIVHRFAYLVLAGIVVLTGVAAWYAAGHLGMDMDTVDLIAERLPWRQATTEYEAAFPQYMDTVVIVVDAPTPDLADEAARRLAERLAVERELVEEVDRPGAGPFFETHGLLFLDPDELEDLSDNLARLQPFLGTLARDPSLRGLFDLLGQAVDPDEAETDLDLAPFLNAVADAVVAADQGRLAPLSWQELMRHGTAEHVPGRALILVWPRLDYGKLLPGGAILERIRALAAELELTPEQGISVRITGEVALSFEEMQTVVQGAGLAGVLSLIMVTLVLVKGLRSRRLVVATMVTLVAGLVWAAAFAAFAVGELNMISVAFAVLYIGLAVDYAIHYALRYRELMVHGSGPRRSLTNAAADVGGSLVLCAITTGIGFFAFLPTDFAGVAELGLITGAGILISLFISLTLLPALLTVFPAITFRPMPVTARTVWSEGWIRRHRLPVLTLSGALGLLALALAPRIVFDDNPLNLRVATSESVATFRDLLADEDASAWSVVVLAHSAEEAQRLAAALKALPLVERVIWLESFIPEDQARKLVQVEEIALIVGPELGAVATEPPPGPEAIGAAMGSLVETLRRFVRATDDPDARAGAERLVLALSAWQAVTPATDAARDARIAGLEANLLSGLAGQIERLAASLEADEVALKTLPDDLVRRWLAPGPLYRIQVDPAEDLDDPGAKARFIAAVRTVVPEAIGPPITQIESARAVVAAFQQALATAVVLIVALLWLVTRSVRDVLLILIPLLMAGVLTIAFMVLAHIPFNFANVIALPLLLGIGVDNGIHMVHRARFAPPHTGSLLQTSTARAVVLSALTTVLSFGNLAFSPHPGTAQMGLVLAVGLLLTLMATLIVLPAMLAGERTAGVETP